MTTVNPHPQPTNPERRARWRRLLFSTFVVSVIVISGRRKPQSAHRNMTQPGPTVVQGPPGVD